MQFDLFKTAQKSVAKDFKITQERWGTLDGESAGFLESRRTTREGLAAHAWNVVTVHRKVPYVIDCEALLADVSQAKPGVDAILNSFRWTHDHGSGDK